MKTRVCVVGAEHVYKDVGVSFWGFVNILEKMQWVATNVSFVIDE